eukprot:7568904-Lingulodinium_polyedra.AAC.1
MGCVGGSPGGMCEALQIGGIVAYVAQSQELAPRFDAMQVAVARLGRAPSALVGPLRQASN